MRRIRFSNLPTEVSVGVQRAVLHKYGELLDPQVESSSSLYRHPVAKGIRLAKITFARHIPSHITVAGSRVLVSYDGQLTECYG